MKTMNYFRKSFALMAAAALFAGCSSSSAPASSTTSSAASSTSAATTEVYSIGLAQLVDHPSLNTIRDAMLDEFSQEGYIEGENLKIDYQNAAGKTSNLDSIMTGYANDGVDAIVAIATPTAMSAQNYADKAPVIFSAVSDPVAAGLCRP